MAFYRSKRFYKKKRTVKRRKMYRNKFTKAVGRALNTIAEHKFRDCSLTAANILACVNGSGGAFWDLTSYITSGTDYYQRIGRKIKVLGVYLKYDTMLESSHEGTAGYWEPIRVIMASTQGEVELYNQLNPTNNIFDSIAMIDHGALKRVHYDKVHMLIGGQRPVQFVRKYVPINRVYTYSADQNSTADSSRLHLGVVSDAASGTTNPGINITARVIFTDI